MEVLGLGAPSLAVAVIVVALGAALQGSLGFGLGLVASPILVLVDNRLVPGVVIAIGVPLSILITWRERDSLDIAPVRWSILGRFLGSFLGAFAVTALGARSLAIAFALAILAAVAVSVAGFTVRRTTTTMLTAGFVSGASGTATSVGGPPMALVLQDSSGPELRASMSAFTAFGSVVSLVLLAALGEISDRQLGISAILIPAAVLGFIASARTNRYLDRGHTRAAVLVVAAVAALAILARNL